jgi:hypothetical protein
VGTSIGTLSVVVGAKVDEFQRGMKEVQDRLESANKQIKAADRDWRKSFGNITKEVRNFGLAMGGIGTAVLGGLFKAVQTTGKLGDELLNLKAKTGMSVEALSELKYMADSNGTSLDAVETSMKGLANTMLEAALGSKTAQQTLALLGLNLKQLQDMTPDERFWAVSNALAGISDEGVRAAAAQDVFGKSGTDLLPILADGQAGIDAMKQKARDLGVVMSEESAQKAADFSQSMDDLKTAMDGLKTAVADVMDAGLKDLITSLKDAVTNGKEWVKENPKLVEALGTLAGIFAVGGAFLVGLTTAATMWVKLNDAWILSKTVLPGLLPMLGLSSTTGLAGALGYVGLAIAGIGGWAIAIKSIVDNFENWVQLMQQTPWKTFMNLISKGTLLDYGGATLTPGTKEKADIAREKLKNPLAPSPTPAPEPTPTPTPAPTQPETQDELEKRIIKMVGIDAARKIIRDVGLIPSFKFGGTVPGPIGAPMLATVHGGETFSGVQNTGGGTSGGDVNIHVGYLLGDDISLSRFVDLIAQKLGRRGRRNSFGPVNQGYFFGRSST